jgi:DNA polymerase III subunit tau-like protein
VARPVAPVAPQPAPAPTGPGDVDIERFERAWPAVMELVKKRKITAHAMFLSAAPAEFADGELVLQFPPINRFHRDKVSEPGSGYLSPLVEAIFETFGVRPAIRCVLGQNEAPTPASQAPNQAQAGQEREEEDDGPVAVGVAPPKDPIDLIREGFAAEIVEETHH